MCRESNSLQSSLFSWLFKSAVQPIMQLFIPGNIQKLKQNKRWKYKWQVWQPPEPSPPTAGSSREVFKFHFPFLWITLFYIENYWLQKWCGLQGKKKRLRKSGHTMKRTFMHLRNQSNRSLSRDGKCFKIWFTLDLYWIITYFGAN